MKKAYLFARILPFLFIMAFLTSCSQQEKSNISKVNPSATESTLIPDVYTGPKIAEYIRNIFQDKNGDLWFGTNGYGAVQFDGDSLSYYSHEQGFNGGQITGITEDLERNILFATDQGVVKYDGSTSEKGEKIFTDLTDPKVFKGNHVWSIFSDSKGIIWAGTSQGINRFDGTNWEPFELPYSADEMAGKFITNRTSWSITEDRKGNLWFATNGQGAFKYDPSDESGTDAPKFTQYTEKDGLTDNSVDQMLEDKEGNMWFGTRFGGLSRYDGKTFTNYTARDSIGNNEVCVIYEDKAGNIWFSSEGFGVYRYSGGAFTNFSKAEGLRVMAVQTIFEDNEGRLWVGGGGGLYRFDGTSFFHVGKNGPWK